MLQNKKIAVILPAYNEARFIGSTLSKLPPFLDYVIVVNDGSTDETLSKIKAYSRPGFHLINHSKRSGVGSALASGFRKALELKTDFVVTMDADGQMDPSDLPTVLQKLLNDEADFVKGNRFHFKGNCDQMPLFRYLANRFFTSLQTLALGKALVRDSQCGFTAMNQKFLKKIDLNQLWSGYGVYNDLAYHAAKLKIRLHNVGVKTIYHQKRSHLKWNDALKILFLLFTQWRRRILKHANFIQNSRSYKQLSST